MRTLGDLYYMFAFGGISVSKDALMHSRTLVVPCDASLLLYTLLHGEDNALSTLINLFPQLRVRLEEETAAGIPRISPAVMVVGGLFEHYMREADDLHSAVMQEDDSHPVVEQFGSDCLNLFSEVPVEEVRDVLERLAKDVLPLMSCGEQVLFALLVSCFCVLDEDSGATPEVIEERIDTFAAVVEAGDHTPNFPTYLVHAFAVVVNAPLLKWFGRSPESCEMLRVILCRIMGLPRLAGLIPFEPEPFPH